MKEQDIKPIRIYWYFDKEKKFIEINKKLPLHNNLNSDRILLFVDPTRDRVWHWRGSKTSPSMQSLARKSVVACIRYSYLLKKFPNFGIADPREKLIILELVTRVIDEGNEPSDFKILVGLMEESDYPEFKVNDILMLKLEDDKTFVYIKGKKFIQCMRLFLQIPHKKSSLYEDVESIDEATEIFNKFLLENRIVEGKFSKPVIDFNNTITPEQEFWGHCSNIQAWVECEYDTRLLHSNLSFPLLKALSDAGDQLALQKFKEEIALRLEGGYFPVILYLIKENYLRYLPPGYIHDLRKRISGAFIPQIFKVLKRESYRSQVLHMDPKHFGDELRQRSDEETSRLRRLKDLLNVPHIIKQMNPKDFILGLAILDFTFLDFFIDPNIENQESYLEDLLERLIEGVKSKDPVFNKATKHFIERIISYLFPRREKESHKGLDISHNSNKRSISWLLEKIYEIGGIGVDLIKNVFSNRLKIVDGNFLTQLELVEDIVSFRSFLKNLLENIESRKNIQAIR